MARDGPWLFGEYSVADAMYAPVVLRLRTYGAQVRESTAAYMATVLADAHMRDWLAAAAAESWIIEESEIGVEDQSMRLENDMKSWLGIAVALACGFCVTATGAEGAGRAFTPTDLNMMARISDPQVSPDGRYVVYVQRETDLEGNRGRSDLWLLDLESANAKPRRLTQHSANDTHPRWAVEGVSIYFLSSRTGSQQIWRLPLTGGEAVQITDYPLDVDHFPLLARVAGASRSPWKCFADCRI